MSSNGTARFAFWWARDIVESATCTLTGSARLLLLLLAGHANAAHYCDPSNDLLARGLGVKPNVRGELEHSTVKRARRELVAAGLVQVFAGGQGPKATNGYWLAVNGATPQAIADAKGVTADPLKKSTRGSRMTPLVVHKGVTGDRLRGSLVTPEVDSEVSKQRARVTSPPPTTKRGKNLLRPGYEDWGAP